MGILRERRKHTLPSRDASRESSESKEEEQSITEQLKQIIKEYLSSYAIEDLKDIAEKKQVQIIAESKEIGKDVWGLIIQDSYLNIMKKKDYDLFAKAITEFVTSKIIPNFPSSLMQISRTFFDDIMDCPMYLEGLAKLLSQCLSTGGLEPTAYSKFCKGCLEADPEMYKRSLGKFVKETMKGMAKDKLEMFRSMELSEKVDPFWFNKTEEEKALLEYLKPKPSE